MSISRSRHYFERSLELSEKYYEKWIEGISKVFLGFVLNKINKKLHSFHKMEDIITEGIKILENRKISPWSSVSYYILGKFYSNNGYPNRAAEFLKTAENLFTEMGMAYWLNRTEKALKKLKIQ
jgi:tetratricopeptide (TPR) repeat protein